MYNKNMEKKKIENLINIVAKFETAMLKNADRKYFRERQLYHWSILKNEFRYADADTFEAYNVMKDGFKDFSYKKSFSKEERDFILELLEEDLESVKKAFERLDKTGRNSFNEKNDYPGGKETELGEYSRLIEKEEKEIKIIRKSNNPILKMFSNFKLAPETAFLVYCVAKKNKREMQENMAVVEALKNPGKPQNPSDIDLLTIPDSYIEKPCVLHPEDSTEFV